jgi:redox-sensitive bicupin YhaK (pirin superfamily)
MSHKSVVFVENAPHPHWVGDGFHVRPLFGRKAFTHAVSPFLMLDYAAPEYFPPRNEPPGVGQHPHRGFETVTIVYAGAVEHRDSAGHSGVIGVGDVQWMTAASGVVHDEFHEREHARKGGAVSMAQLWVNLPAASKMTKPRYQNLRKDDIPTVDLPDHAGTLRIIAGAYGDRKGPALTFSPVGVWDARLTAGKSASLAIPAGHRSLIAVLEGDVRFGEKPARTGDVVFFSDTGETIELKAETDAKLLVLSGEPIDEPIAHYGPFVMNTEAELRQAIEDFRNGRMGELPEPEEALAKA